MQTHTDADTHTRTQRNTHKHTQTHTQTHTHRHKHTDTHTETYTYTHRHTHRYTHTDTQTQTHSHPPHTLPNFPFSYSGHFHRGKVAAAEQRYLLCCFGILTLAEFPHSLFEAMPFPRHKLFNARNAKNFSFFFLCVV